MDDWDIIGDVERRSNFVPLANLVCTVQRYPDDVMVKYNPVETVRGPFGISATRYRDAVIAAFEWDSNGSSQGYGRRVSRRSFGPRDLDQHVPAMDFRFVAVNWMERRNEVWTRLIEWRRRDAATALRMFPNANAFMLGYVWTASRLPPELNQLMEDWINQRMEELADDVAGEGFYVDGRYPEE